MAKKASKKLPTAKATDCASPVAYRQTKEDIERQRRFQAEDGLRTLNQAEEIRKDKRRMSDIKQLATEQMNSLKKFAK